MRSRRFVALGATVTLAVGVPALMSPDRAVADEVRTVKADDAKFRKCHAEQASGRGVTGFRVAAPSTGLVRVRLDPVSAHRESADWDVAVFDRADGRLVAASAAFRSYEVADGFANAGADLWVQACRISGNASKVQVSTTFAAAAPPAANTSDPSQLVSVSTPTQADKTKLLTLDLDLAEGGSETTIDVVLHGKADAQKLAKSGLRYDVRIADLGANAAKQREADKRFRAQVAQSGLPSGRTEYRRLADYDYEMKALARDHPSLVKAFILPERSVEGRDIGGIEIATNVSNLADGKPIFLNMGVHHAREWPAGEHPMEWAYELVNGYRNDARVTRLVGATRNIIVPIVNPDGFTVSREAAPLGDFSAFDYEMKRKNCNPNDAPTPELRSGLCPANPAGRLRGTDPNRNYAGWWGGNGASTNWRSDTFRGSAPFSEPETRNIRALVSARPVTNLITNHTFSNLVLRPPGVAAQGQPVDEPVLKALGAQMAAHNGYANIRGFQLYDTTGTTEDWSYWVTGGLGYTFEIGGVEFHPPYAEGVVAEYLGLAPAAGAGLGGNREAYFAMLEATADSANHATITGQAPAGWTLRVHKEFQTPTSPVRQPDGSVGVALMYKDVLDNTFQGTGGAFSFAVNPSTRPFVAGRYGRLPAAPTQPESALPNPAGEPAENTGSPFEGPHEEVPFTIGGLPTYDNGEAHIRIQWTHADTDWDLYIVDATGNVVGQSAGFGTNFEEAVLIDPVPGDYKAIIVNYDQIEGRPFDDWTTGNVSFRPPAPPVPGVTETWTLTCEKPSGRIAAVRQVDVGRGQTVDVGDFCRSRPQKPRARQ